MKTSSAKAKGRRLQQLLRDLLREIGRTRGLEDGDIESRGMGQNGEDIILSPAALKIFPLAVECKNVESLNVHNTFWEHYEKYKESKNRSILVHAKNHYRPLVTLQLSDFLSLVEKGLSVNQGAAQTKNIPGQDPVQVKQG